MEGPAADSGYRRQRSGDAPAQHRALVDALRDAGHIATPRVGAAFRAIPRHLFLPDVPLDTVYSDDAIPTKERGGVAISSSSQPAVMAVMLEQLDLRPGQRVLEVGAGTGYNAALMAHIVGGAGQVVTVDIDDDIVADARAHVAAAGVGNVEVVCGDGADGYPDAAPYDRIILTVGAWDIAPAWVAQLKPGGRLLLPLALQGTVQKLVAFERADGHLVSVSVRDGGFMPLRGAWAAPETHLSLGSKPGLSLGLGSPRAVDADTVYSLLTGPSRAWPTPVRVGARDLWGGVSLWLALHAPDMCDLTASGDVAEAIVSDMFAISPTYRATVGLLGPTALCVLADPRDHASAADDRSPEVWVRSFGAGDGLARSLVAHLVAWEAAGRPSTPGLRIRAYLSGVAPTAEVDDVVIAKKRTRLVLDWPARA